MCVGLCASGVMRSLSYWNAPPRVSRIAQVYTCTLKHTTPVHRRSKNSRARAGVWRVLGEFYAFVAATCPVPFRIAQWRRLVSRMRAHVRHQLAFISILYIRSQMRNVCQPVHACLTRKLLINACAHNSVKERTCVRLLFTTLDALAWRCVYGH